MKFSKLLPLILLLVLAALVFTVKNCRQTKPSQPKQSAHNQVDTVINSQPDQSVSRGLNRHPRIIHYSKHAKCRMDCRHIDEDEIKEILEQGTINYRKSELQGEPCKKKYAVEGISKDGQKLRIIFAPCGNEMTVVTCIDLGVEWSCNCK